MSVYCDTSGRVVGVFSVVILSDCLHNYSGQRYNFFLIISRTVMCIERMGTIVGCLLLKLGALSKAPLKKNHANYLHRLLAQPHSYE